VPRLGHLPGDDHAHQPFTPTVEPPAGRPRRGVALAIDAALPALGPSPRAGHPAAPRPGLPEQPRAAGAQPVRPGGPDAPTLAPVQQPPPGRVVSPPDQAAHASRVEVRIGRVEVRIVPPPPSVAHASVAVREPRAPDPHALARRYLDRRWY
jgi:hypothetical protein